MTHAVKTKQQHKFIETVRTPTGYRQKRCWCGCTKVYDGHYWYTTEGGRPGAHK